MNNIADKKVMNQKCTDHDIGSTLYFLVVEESSLVSEMLSNKDMASLGESSEAKSFKMPRSVPSDYQFGSN